MTNIVNTKTIDTPKSLADVYKPIDVAPKTTNTRRRVAGLALSAASLFAGYNQLQGVAPATSDKAPAVATSAPKKPSTTLDHTPPTSIHTVQEGENPWTIAEDAKKAGDIKEVADTAHEIAAQEDSGGNLQPDQKVEVTQSNR
jgi:hypothetical protein